MSLNVALSSNWVAAIHRRVLYVDTCVTRDDNRDDSGRRDSIIRTEERQTFPSGIYRGRERICGHSAIVKYIPRRPLFPDSDKQITATRCAFLAADTARCVIEFYLESKMHHATTF